MPDLRHAIRDAMTRRDMTQQELAAASGLTQPQISRYLNGEGLRDSSIERLMEALGIRATTTKARMR